MRAGGLPNPVQPAPSQFPQHGGRTGQVTRGRLGAGADVVQQAPVPRWGWDVAPPLQP